MTIEASDVLDDAEEEVHAWRDHVRDAADYFHDHEGELFKRDEAIDNLSEELDIRRRMAATTLSNLVSDTVDPIIQVSTDGDRYVGVIEFEEFDGAYGYVNFDDRFGRGKRVVCAQCVHDAEFDKEVTHATAGDPNGSFGKDSTYDELLDAVHRHYSERHDEIPENVETGASLASGTTIGGNSAWHQGNDNDLYLTTGNDELVVETRTSDPSSPADGRFWIRTDL